MATHQNRNIAAELTENVDEEEILRSTVYNLLSRLLIAAPDAALLDELKTFQSDNTVLGRAYATLGSVARDTDLLAAATEYQSLFIGIGKGELTPFSSYYLTGFLHEKPLANLRTDLRKLGLERSELIYESEDHIAMLLEVMAGLIDGRFGKCHDLSVQKDFFDQHIISWAAQFFTDLQQAEAARFYMPVGQIGLAFLEIEQRGFAMMG